MLGGLPGGGGAWVVLELTGTLERLSCHEDFKITQAQTKVSFIYLNALLQVEFRAIGENFHTFS